MSKPKDSGRLGLFGSILLLLGLAVLAFWALREPLSPDAEDCSAQGRAHDCWRDSGKEAYDLEEPRR